jgi:AcrR family transcriptional regulator
MMGRREEKKRDTRKRLIDTGLELFRGRGFDDTRVKDIVERVGVSPATFFNYFPTKQAILEAQAEQTADLYAALLTHELERTDVPCVERLEEITRLLAEALQSDRAIARLMVTRTQLFFGSTGDKADKDRAAQRLLAQLFAQGQANGEIEPEADPLQLAEIYTALTILTAANWLIDWWGPPLESLEDRLLAALATFLRGASPHPQPQT